MSTRGFFTLLYFPFKYLLKLAAFHNSTFLLSHALLAGIYFLSRGALTFTIIHTYSSACRGHDCHDRHKRLATASKSLINLPTLANLPQKCLILPCIYYANAPLQLRVSSKAVSKLCCDHQIYICKSLLKIVCVASPVHESFRGATRLSFFRQKQLQTSAAGSKRQQSFSGWRATLVKWFKHNGAFWPEESLLNIHVCINLAGNQTCT